MIVTNQRGHTHLFTLKHFRTVVSVVFSTLDARLGRLDVDREPWQVRVFSIRLREEQRCILTGGNATAADEERRTERDGTYSITFTPVRGMCLVGLVALLGSSGPRPSSPSQKESPSDAENAVKKLDLPFAAFCPQATVITVGSPVSGSSSSGVRSQ
jgi:hypothetical protein